MKKFLSVAMAMVLSTTLFAQQNIKSDNVGDYTSINLSGKLSVEMINADKNAIDVELINCDITKFKWSVGDGGLSMSLRSSSNSDAKATVKIYYKSLKNVEISGSEVVFNDPWCGDMLTMKVSGGARVTAAIECKDIELSAVGNSALMCSGQAKYIDIHASEKSRVDARQMEGVSVNVDSATGAEVYVLALERLIAYAKTASSIFYKGEPTILKIRASKVVGMGASVLSIGK